MTISRPTPSGFQLATPGAVARTAAPRVGEAGWITVVDLNPGMIAYGSGRPPPSGAPVCWQQADASALPLPDGSVDVVYCQQGLQFFPDPESALEQAARVLVPGGRIGLAVWRPLHNHPAFADFVDVLPHHLEMTAVPSLRAPVAGPDRRCVSARLMRAGFDAIRGRISTFEVRFASPRHFFQAEAWDPHWPARSPRSARRIMTG